jgi:hypothetical protein
MTFLVLLIEAPAAFEGVLHHRIITAAFDYL